MKSRSRFPYVSILFLLLVVVAGAVLAQEPTLKSLARPLVWGGSCDPGLAKVIAGSRFFLIVTNPADQPAQALVPGWPEGYLLEAALDLPQDQPFVTTPGLMERLEPTRYLGQRNRVFEKRLLSTSDDYVDLRSLNSKDFVMRIPDDLAGHTIHLRARFDRGDVHLVSKAAGPITIIAPCDESDTARIIATHIYEAWQTNDYTRAVVLADSMLACGLSDAAGWEVAKSCAMGCGQIDKAAAYLERLWEDFGVLGVEIGTSDPPVFNRGGPRDPSLQAGYERTRNAILQLKEAQEPEQR